MYTYAQLLLFMKIEEVGMEWGWGGSLGWLIVVGVGVDGDFGANRRQLRGTSHF